MREHFDVPPVPVLAVVIEGVPQDRDGRAGYLFTGAYAMPMPIPGTAIDPDSAIATLPEALREYADLIEAGKGILTTGSWPE